MSWDITPFNIQLYNPIYLFVYSIIPGTAQIGQTGEIPRSENRDMLCGFLMRGPSQVNLVNQRREHHRFNYLVAHPIYLARMNQNHWLIHIRRRQPNQKQNEPLVFGPKHDSQTN